jgi:hypothetical protein
MTISAHEVWNNFTSSHSSYSPSNLASPPLSSLFLFQFFISSLKAFWHSHSYSSQYRFFPNSGGLSDLAKAINYFIYFWWDWGLDSALYTKQVFYCLSHTSNPQRPEANWQKKDSNPALLKVTFDYMERNLRVPTWLFANLRLCIWKYNHFHFMPKHKPNLVVFYSYWIKYLLLGSSSKNACLTSMRPW